MISKKIIINKIKIIKMFLFKINSLFKVYNKVKIAIKNQYKILII